MRQEEVKALVQRYIGDRTAAAVDRVVHRAVILELPIPSYRAQSAKARSQASSGAGTADGKREEDTNVNDDRTDGARTAP